MVTSPIMNRRAFTLIELLIVVAIVAVLVGVALPYYQNYVKETKIAKAKYELDIMKEALIKFNTFEDRKFGFSDQGAKLELLLGKYLQNLPFDPWGRAYEVMPDKGQLLCKGPDHVASYDDVLVDYEPPLALQKASWIDMDNNLHITTGDLLRLEFSKMLQATKTAVLTNASPTPGGTDLQFSSEVLVGNMTASMTVASSSDVYLRISAFDDNSFFPGSSTVRVAPTNLNLLDNAGRLANGSNGQYQGMEVTIQSR